MNAYFRAILISSLLMVLLACSQAGNPTSEDTVQVEVSPHPVATASISQEADVEQTPEPAVIPFALPQIIPGQTTKEEVREQLGPPSDGSDLDEAAWFYSLPDESSNLSFHFEGQLVERIYISISDFNLQQMVNTLGEPQLFKLILPNKYGPPVYPTKRFYYPELGIAYWLACFSDCEIHQPTEVIEGVELYTPQPLDEFKQFIKIEPVHMLEQWHEWVGFNTLSKRPTAQPTPTWGTLDNLLDDWLDGQPCAPPCWKLLTPGQPSDFIAIYSMLEENPAMTNLWAEPDGRIDLLMSWQWAELPEKGGEVKLDSGKKGLVGIRLEGPADGSWPLEEVISRYGEPSHVYAAVSEEQEEPYELILLFVDHGFALLGSDSVKPDLTSDWRALEVLFFEPTKEGFAIGLGEPSVVNKLQPWQGMTSFDSYCQEQDCQPSP